MISQWMLFTALAAQALQHGSEKQALVAENAQAAAAQACSILKNVRNVLYTTTIEVGTPPKSFDVVSDTGSDALVLPDYACRSCSIKGKSLYQPSNSSSFRSLKAAYRIQYGSGTVSGRMFEEKVSAFGLEVANQWIGSIHRESLKGYEIFEYDGVLGLGMPNRAIGSGDKTTSFLENAHVNSFSICYERNGNGDFIRGGDPTLQYLTTPVDENEKHWSVPLSGIRSAKISHVNAKSPNNSKIPVCDSSNSCSAIIDSGTTLIIGPKDHLDHMYSNLCSYLSGCKGQNVTARSKSFLKTLLSCPNDLTSLPNIEFNLGGHWISLDPLNYVMITKHSLPHKNKKLDLMNQIWGEEVGSLLETGDFHLACLPVFSKSPPALKQIRESWIIGMPLMRQYSVKFDKGSEGMGPSIGFAALTGCCGKCKQCGHDVAAFNATALPDVNDEDARKNKQGLFSEKGWLARDLQQFDPYDHEVLLGFGASAL